MKTFLKKFYCVNYKRKMCKGDQDRIQQMRPSVFHEAPAGKRSAGGVGLVTILALVPGPISVLSTLYFIFSSY